jgi:hypothetical protein
MFASHLAPEDGLLIATYIFDLQTDTGAMSTRSLDVNDSATFPFGLVGFCWGQKIKV